MAGLDRKIEVKIGAKITLRRNIDIGLWLVNGAVGTIKWLWKGCQSYNYSDV